MRAIFHHAAPEEEVEPALSKPAVPQEDHGYRAPAAHEPQRPAGYPFVAEIDVAELDVRAKPGIAWAAKAMTLSRSHVVIRSRRMCYIGTRLIIGVHLIDDEPMPLCGTVCSCEYLAEGSHIVDIDLEPVPENSDVAGWLASRGQ
jgi:hypothetical protein